MYACIHIIFQTVIKNKSFARIAFNVAIAHVTLMLPLSAQACTFTKDICFMMSCPRGKVEGKAIIRSINTVTFHLLTKTPNRREGFPDFPLIPPGWL